MRWCRPSIHQAMEANFVSFLAVHILTTFLNRSNVDRVPRDCSYYFRPIELHRFVTEI